MAKLVHEACELALVGAKEQGIDVRYDIDPHLDRVIVDRVQVQQVIVNLVRNALQVAWDGGQPLSKEERLRRIETRSLSIPEGAKAERLRVVGWVEDSRNHIRAIAQSRCASAPSKG